MHSIAIVGAGQIGSRHLQAMIRSELAVRLFVVDPNRSSLDVSKQRFDECGPAPMVASVEYVQRIEDLPSLLDLVIIATGAQVRRAVLEALLAHVTVPAIILEKVLLQRLVDLEAVGAMLTARGIAAWVNCPRRQMAHYAELKARLAGASTIDFAVTAAQLGIGCNSIHYLDLCAFLTGQTTFELSGAGLDDATIPSKRAGYVEFTGVLAGHSERGDRFAVTSYAQGGAPNVVTITTESVRYIVRETEGRCWTSSTASEWAWREEDFTLPFQSQLTHHAVAQILREGSCDLTPYAESASLHTAVLTPLLAHLNRSASTPTDVCPIT